MSTPDTTVTAAAYPTISTITVPVATIDEMAISVVKRFHANEITEPEARHELLDLGQLTGIAHEVAKEGAARHAHVNACDIEPLLSEIVFGKINGTVEHPYDLDAARNSSLSGYIRQVCRGSLHNVIEGKIREQDRRDGALNTFSESNAPCEDDPLSIESEIARFQDGRRSLAATGMTGSIIGVPGAGKKALKSKRALSKFRQSVAGEEADNEFALPTRAERNMRKDEFRPHVQAQILRAIYGVPAAVRPPSRSARLALQRRLNADDGVALAVASLRAHATEATDVSEATESLMPLWSDYSTEDAHTLLASPEALSVHVMAMAAVADWPRPSTRLMASKAVHLAREFKDIAPALAPISQALVNAGVANECVSYSVTTLSSLHGPMNAVADEARSQYRPLLFEVANHPDAPWGTNPTQVARKLREYVRSFAPLPTEESVDCVLVDLAQQEVAARSDEF